MTSDENHQKSSINLLTAAVNSPVVFLYSSDDLLSYASSQLMSTVTLRMAHAEQNGQKKLKTCV